MGIPDVGMCCRDLPFNTKVHAAPDARSTGFWKVTAVPLPGNHYHPKGATWPATTLHPQGQSVSNDFVKVQGPRPSWKNPEGPPQLQCSHVTSSSSLPQESSPPDTCQPPRPLVEFALRTHLTCVHSSVSSAAREPSPRQGGKHD